MGQRPRLDVIASSSAESAIRFPFYVLIPD